MVVFEDEVGRVAAKLGRPWSSRTRLYWSIFSVSVDEAQKSLAKMAFLLLAPLAGVYLTSIGRPCSSSGVDGFAGLEASGFVPVFNHGCSDLNFLLRRGKEDGLDCFVSSFSEVFLTNARDPYVISVFDGIPCNHFVLPLLY
jgi:hypothetical protein